MRKELELIERIEQYLQGQLSATEKALFENQMAEDASLREAVTLQQEVMYGLERAALRQQVQAAGTRFKTIRRITRWGLPGAGIIIIAAAIFYYGNHHHWPGLHFSGSGTETEESRLAAAGNNIPSQSFVIDAGRDTVIETKGGIVLSVPANGFLDGSSQPVQGRVELTVKEALDAATIIKAGLSTKSGNQLLESGGMFFIDATKEGRTVNLNPSNGIYAELPAPFLKPAGMQLYKGKRLPDGSIDWVSPIPLERDLMSVDIAQLDFYPPHYLDSLSRWGYDARDKHFTDSLYYSLAIYFTPPSAAPSTAPVMEYSPLMDDGPKGRDSISDTMHYLPVNRNHHSCFLNPAKIKTIWSKQFQNTLLSTREFAQRLVWLHGAGNNAALDLYINNLDKNLSDIDSMAAAILSGEYRERFLLFAAQHDGKVKTGTRQLDKLRAYYQAKTLAYAQAIAKTHDEFWQKQAELDDTALQKKIVHDRKDEARLAQNFKEEFSLNLKEAYRQLGYDTTIRPRPLSTNVYTMRLTGAGWYNVDKAVYESTVQRTTLNYTDTATGKKAVIHYRPVSFQVIASRVYDRLYVYLLPDKLNSFMRLQATDSIYAEQLDELMQYNMVCIGWKGEQAFFYSLRAVESKNYPPIALIKIDKSKLDELLNSIANTSQAIDMKEEANYFLFEIQDQKRQKRNEEMMVLWYKLVRFLIPCEDILK